MSWEISCANMCRACMKVDGVLLPMYDDETISRKNLPVKLAELASIQIDQYDGLPNMLCAKCAYRTDAFYDFKLQVQATERKLRKMFDTHTNHIKEEAESCGYDQDCVTQVNDSHNTEMHTLEEKLDVESVNRAERLEETLNNPIKISNENEQQLEIDVSQLVSEDTDMKSANIDLRNILISKVDNVEILDHDKQHIVKNEIPEEISKILQSQDLDYTIMYIPEGAINSIVQTDAENSLVCEPEGTIKLEGNKGIYVSACSTEVMSEAENGDELINSLYVSNETKEHGITGGSRNTDGKSWEPVFSNRQLVKMESAASEEKTAVEHVKAEDSDSSDSDYFIDPKDNILGSLNDTITRIKEIKLEGNVMQYQCTLCLQNYDKLTGVLLHTIDNHVPSSGPFFCVVCEKDCESHRQLRAHVKTHTGQFPYSCFICNRAYTMKRYLKRHMVCHTDFPRHRCPKCGVRFKVKSELESHVTTHIHGAPFACSQCPRLFNHKGNYKRHLITHLDPQGLHLPKYPCKVCGKRFLNNRTLETHMRVHTGEKPFKCEICGRSFSQQGNLLNHLRIHSNPRSYTCEVCGKRFNQRATLRDHSLLHTGEKPYVCNVCGIAFTFSAALRRHMWTHAGGKPFGCEICDARFVGKYDLRRHMRVHSDRPRTKRKRNAEKQVEAAQEESKDETITVAVQERDTETILVEQVLLNQEVTQVVPQEESEKENVDALFNLIQYG